MQTPRYLYGILGQPLGHSLSPALHTWGFSRSGHPGAFYRWEKTQEDLPAFFSAVRTLPISGLCVTIPHKEHVLPFLDSITTRARSAGAVNTIINCNGSLTGDNTDVAGFLHPLQSSNAEASLTSALVLGAGGASRAVLTGLQELGVRDIAVTARRDEQAERIAAEFSCTVIPWDEREAKTLQCPPSIVVNTTPMGMRGERVTMTPLSLQTLCALANENAPSSLPIIYDIVYNPAKTCLLQNACKAKLPIIDGISFFVAQGLEQFRLWTGETLPFSEAQFLINEALE